MSKTPDPNNTGAGKEATVKVPSGDPKKKDEKKEEDLSEEDLALKQQLDLYVERVQDADHGLRKVALESMRQEIRTATSSMTSVPKPLKFLRPHYGTLKGFYEKMPDSDLKKLLADILSVLALTMSAEGERESLKYRLLGSQGDIGSWGHEYVRNLAGEIGQEYVTRQESKETDLFGNRMDSRRKIKSKARLDQELEELEKYRGSNPKLTEQFTDLKSKLHTLSREDWETIPEFEDYLENEKKRSEKPVPDTVAEGERRRAYLAATLDNKSESLSGQKAVAKKAILKPVPLAAGDIIEARITIREVPRANSGSEEIWDDALKLEFDNGEIDRAKQLLDKARKIGVLKLVVMKWENILNEASYKDFNSFPNRYSSTVEMTTPTPTPPRHPRSVFLGVDVGTGSARAGLFNEDGKLLGTTSSPMQIWKDGDCVELSSTDIWLAICGAVKTACVLGNVSKEEVKGLLLLVLLLLSILRVNLSRFHGVAILEGTS